MNFFRDIVLLGNNRNIARNSFLWNSIAGLINAAEAVLILAVVTRTNGLEDAGIITIAFSVANLMMTIGKYGVRNYHVTDVSGLYTFSIYLKARIVSVMAMIGGVIIYLIYGFVYKDYTIYKALIIFLICLLYVIESFEDVYLGLYQQIGRLDVASKIFSIRWAGAITVFIFTLVLINNIVISMMVMVVFSFGSMVYMLKATFYKLTYDRIEIQNPLGNIGLLLKACTPLFLSAFLAYYITNVPKYAIDSMLDDKMQAYYGFIAMPVFIISLINSFLYQPILVKIAIEWKKKNISNIKKIILQQILIIIGITGICLIGAFICGIPVLSLLYGTDLSGYKKELLILLFSGGMLAIVGFFNVILTVMRKQNSMLYAYGGAALISGMLCDYFIQKKGLMGAAQFNLIITFILAFLLIIIIRKEISK